LKNNQSFSNMPRGGFREGAGRKKGVRNKRTQRLYAEVTASGETPLDYMLRIMRDETVDARRRDQMAMTAAPYVHAKPQSTEQIVETLGSCPGAREKLARLVERAAAAAKARDG
jgi:hypothetical protein